MKHQLSQHIKLQHIIVVKTHVICNRRFGCFCLDPWCVNPFLNKHSMVVAWKANTITFTTTTTKTDILSLFLTKMQEMWADYIICIAYVYTRKGTRPQTSTKKLRFKFYLK